VTGTALGLVETVGLTAAVEAADAAAKAADVRVVGYEVAGGGLVTVKVLGQVAAVRAAVAAGAAAAARVGTVRAVHVIPRSASGLEFMVHSQDTVPPPPAEGPSEAPPGLGGPAETGGPGGPGASEETEASRTPDAAGESVPPDAAGAEPGGTSAAEAGEVAVAAPGEEAADLGPEEHEVTAVVPPEDAGGVPEVEGYAPYPAAGEASCNICGDPACPRRKGEPRSKCIHHGAE
jgi:hypothetical protein